METTKLQKSEPVLSEELIKPIERRMVTATELAVVNEIVETIQNELRSKNLDVTKEFHFYISKTQSKVLTYNGLFLIKRACMINFWECSYESGDGYGGGKPGFWIGHSNV